MSFKGDFSIKRFAAFISTNAICLLTSYYAGFLAYNETSPMEKYGYYNAILIYMLKMTTLIGILPITAFIIGSTFFCHDIKEEKSVKIPEKKICFRVVTRGMYPQLVKKNLNYNMSVIKGFENLKYTYEVVTDKKIGDFNGIERCYELVVPDDYSTKTGTLYKARALQYALEQNVSNLADDDWVVHLDEESRLTKSCVIGIMNFANRNKHQIGQGLICYGKGEVVSWLNTLADSTRASHDLGPLRFGLKYLNKSLMDFKGSFIVSQHGVEKFISFDHGLEGSITEDTFFAIKASNNGFKLDWIDGEMHEQSPFTFMDFLRQRRRWYQGTYHVAYSNNLIRDLSGSSYRMLYYLHFVSVFGTLSFIINLFFPVSFHPADTCLHLTIEASLWYFYWFGFSKNFNLDKICLPFKILFILAAPIIVHYLDICDTCAFIWAVASAKSDFQIIKKSFETTKM